MSNVRYLSYNHIQNCFKVTKKPEKIMTYLLEGKCTTSDHSLKAAVSSILRASDLKFTEHDTKVFACVTS